MTIELTKTEADVIRVAIMDFRLKTEKASEGNPTYMTEFLRNVELSVLGKMDNTVSNS